MGITLFCTFLCRHYTTTTWKCLISRFYGGREHKTTISVLVNLKTAFNIQLLKKSPTFVHGHTGSASRGPFGNYRATVLASGLLRRPPDMAFQILQDLGPVMHINSTLEPQWNQVWKFFGGCFSNRYRSVVWSCRLKKCLHSPRQ